MESVAESLPRGTVTFVFTDLRDSTRLWEAHPEEMRASVRRHDALVRQTVEDAGGLVVKTMGDGVMAAFADAPSAVAAAVSLQRAILAIDWPIPMAARTGLHTGVAEPEIGDYHSPAVNRAARVAAAAQPGQILVTAATAALVDGFTFRDLGEREMRGLPPTRVFQVVAEGLSSEFPDATVAVRRAAMPVPATSFVGRAEEIPTLAGLLRDHKLVTLTGAGGCGKTRLAIEVAADLEPSFDDGALFVDLAPLTEASRVVDAVSDALGLVSSSGETDAVSRLRSYLTTRRTLLVLDNCEHVLDAVAELAATLITTGDSIRILATSREPLALPGESVYVVPSLAPETDAVRLFAERAAEARVGFSLDDVSRASVVEICRRLDGIPLAIELAAASVRLLAPAQILERLDDRFRLLTGGRRRVQRHQTLAATLDWSHDLLSEPERIAFRRLAVFPATFSLEAAEHVVDRADTVESLASLVDKSLVNVVAAGERMRYRLLESVRLYAEPKLVDAGEALDCRARQRDWVVQWLEATPLEERWFGDRDFFDAEHANISTAIDWSAVEGDLDSLGRLAGGIDWARSEAWREGERRCREVLADNVVENDVQLQACLMLWWLSPIAPTGYILEWGELGVGSMTTMPGDPRPLHALALSGHGRNLTVPAAGERDETLRARAVALADAGAELSERFGTAWRKVARLMSGMAHATLHNIEPADSHFAAGIAVAPGAPPFQLLHGALEGYLAITRLLLGHAHEAADWARAADARVRPALDTTMFPYWLHSPGIALPVTLGEVGDTDAAHEALVAYHAVQRNTDFHRGLESVTLVGGILAAQRGDWEVASRLLAAGSRGAGRTTADWVLYTHFRNRVRAAIPEQQAHELRAAGRAMAIDDAVARALA